METKIANKGRDEGTALLAREAALVDAGGVVLDTAAAAVPGIPGGAGAAIKAARAGEKRDPPSECHRQ